MKTVGHFIREKRTEHNWSLAQLSMKIGADPSTISKWENHNRTPNLKYVLKMTKVFNCTIDELFGSEVNAK
jgi:transcriptional regulator with XRE-family HTH domain